MQLRTVLLPLGVATLVLTIACAGSPEMAMQGTAEDEAAIRALPDRYETAYNANDAAGIAALAYDGYQAVMPDGTLVSGKSGVEKMVGMDMQMNEKMAPEATLDVSLDFLNWLDAGNATIGGTWTMNGAPPEAPGSGSWLAVVHKTENGEWLLASDLAAPNLPPPPAVDTAAAAANAN
jgi:uncharacterized protein (TIGR02246 family)